MPKIIETVIEYAFVRGVTFLPNIKFTEGELTTYKHRISIIYDVLDADRKEVYFPPQEKNREHYSEAFETIQSYADYKAWRDANEANFIAADKFELSGFQQQ